MARRRVTASSSFDNASASFPGISETEDELQVLRSQQPWRKDHSTTSTKGARTMPLTQDKMDYSVSNNNDHNYLHKKFKKMASTLPASPSESKEETTTRETNVARLETHVSLPNGSIPASLSAIHKLQVLFNEEINVQNTFNGNNVRLSDVNKFEQTPGKTSFSNEFSNKTETLDNDFTKDIQNGAGGRNVCPYCKLSCAKPSVLRKHIRAHTNERPYPCVPCDFAFKTKSNLYKHQRSRTHALRSQGADIPVPNEEDLSAESESDTSLPPTSVSDPGSDASNLRLEIPRPNEFSSPELSSDRITPPTLNNLSSSDNKFKLYKPKFRAALYSESDEKDRARKPFSTNADFLNEHISKIISDNEAIVDIIETPLIKKYGKIKQIAESKQLHQINENSETKFELSPLNLTKGGSDTDSTFRKRSHSETFSQVDFQKHPLNPEGSIIKDLLLKTKALNGLSPINGETVDGQMPLFVCPLCQIPYRSADNLEIHRMYYCKGIATNTNIMRDTKVARPENVFVRSNSINVRLPESPTLMKSSRSPPLRQKPDNLIIIKTECNDVITPLPSPGPLLGNTRLVDTRVPSEYSRKSDNFKIKSTNSSPRRRIESRYDSSSPSLSENSSPRPIEAYYSKIRSLDTGLGSPGSMRSMDEMSQHSKNPTSLQMFGGAVKIVNTSGGTTTLRIEPSKHQLSPILVQQDSSPSKQNSESEANIIVRSGLLSGGTIVHNPQTPKNVSSQQLSRLSQSTTPSSLHSANISMQDIPHFQFPPLSDITAFNPLTLPPLSPSTPNGATSILHGGKLIPHVPGIPGPNTPSIYVGSPSKVHSKNDILISPLETTTTTDMKHGLLSINILPNNNLNIPKFEISHFRKSLNDRPSESEIDKYNSKANMQSTERKLTKPLIKVRNIDEPSTSSKVAQSSMVKSITPRHDGGVKRSIDGVPRNHVQRENANSLSKLRIADKINVSKTIDHRTPETEIRNFNFENLITKAEIYNIQIPSSSDVQKNISEPEVVSDASHNERSETSYFQKNNNVKSGSDERKPKFLRPSTLPLKPGTFTPKRHHGITPNANTMPLVSPETPRPAKAYGQLYLNGNAYTYLGLKCSTKVFYCTINRPQPTYVPKQHFLSMYSNWQLLSELTPDPLGLSASTAMSLYDSRHRPQNTIVSEIKQDLILTHSSQWNRNRDAQLMQTGESKRNDESKLPDGSIAPKKELTGGFESNEEYTYIRGRGRGRYVCAECGIRCKKPSMLKKHIRTHTDVRPYTCTHCNFSFKTKGNLTKHMKSKAHYKKCCELGINPNEGADLEGADSQCAEDTDEETESDGDEGNEGETESSDTEACRSRLPEHEAAHCLLSLGGGARPATCATPGLITSARPTTYPYTSEHQDLAAGTAQPDRTKDMEEPMDLSRTESRTPAITEIPTARESSVLASLASNTAKLPQTPTQWTNGEPMLHAYLTERALLDTKIKQSQFTSTKLKKVESEKSSSMTDSSSSCVNVVSSMPMSSSHVVTTESMKSVITTAGSGGIVVSAAPAPPAVPKEEPVKPPPPPPPSVRARASEPPPVSAPAADVKKTRAEGNAENAKFVVSEYLKQSRVNSAEHAKQSEFLNDAIRNSDGSMTEEANSDSDGMKPPGGEHEAVARKVVIGVGGVAFKVSAGKELCGGGGGGAYSAGRLMEDGRRVCDFCNKSFTKPSQLRLHLNIHYMERPYRCEACAVSFRTRGHLQKHERSGSHHNKVSMTSTFGAATSMNPRPFGCSDCNIGFRIHGHLAKHLRSKLHVMRLECLFKLPFGTFTEIERAGVSLTDIDTTDCASALASLQLLARRLHQLDPTKLEYRDVPGGAAGAGGDTPPPPDRTIDDSDLHDKDTRVMFSATDN